MCLILLHFQPCAGSEPDCNCCCCLSNKYTYMQLRSPEVPRLNFHLTHCIENKVKDSMRVQRPPNYHTHNLTHTHSHTHTHTHTQSHTLSHTFTHKPNVSFPIKKKPMCSLENHHSWSFVVL